MKDFIDFLKAASVFVFGIVAIIVAAGVWNGVYKDAIPSFYGWVAGFNLIAEGVAIYFYQKYINAFGEDVKEEKKETKKATKK